MKILRSGEDWNSLGKCPDTRRGIITAALAWYTADAVACLKILCVNAKAKTAFLLASAFRTVPERAALLISHFLESFREARPLKNQTAQGRALPDDTLCVLICET